MIYSSGVGFKSDLDIGLDGITIANYIQNGSDIVMGQKTGRSATKIYGFNIDPVATCQDDLLNEGLNVGWNVLISVCKGRERTITAFAAAKG